MKIALLGVGMMGEAVLAGLVSSGVDAAGITVTDVRTDRSDELVSRYGVRFATRAVDAVSGADVVLVVVKPYDVPALLDEISASLDPDAVVVSLAAGLTLAQLEAHVAPGQPVVRVMPNTPAKVGVGMSAISPGTHATDDHTARASEVMGAVGEV
ncbi:MAG TPA: NAD(P)-binding domain-containing protein, partial [Propionibacteriaceae bacterium]|nr:NAD(P)-binding domain-containing protein [Propionibacteriaceae bacterium]